MGHRCLAFMGTLGVAVAVLQLAPAPVAGQTPTARATTGTAIKAVPAPPTTPWGDPDLQGIWNDDYRVPLQRLPRDVGKEFRTEEEIAALDKQRAALIRRDDRADRGTEEDVAGAYGEVYFFNKAYGPAHVADCGSAGWENPAPHAGGTEEEGRDTSISARPPAKYRSLQEPNAVVPRWAVRAAFTETKRAVSVLQHGGGFYESPRPSGRIRHGLALSDIASARPSWVQTDCAVA